MVEFLSEIGDLVFSLVIGYIGAIEFLYVVRHLYHWSFNHDTTETINDEDRLAHLQENMRNQLAKATNNEDKTGNKVMKDGVQYKDGFRIDPIQEEINGLKEKLRDKELSDLKRKELEKELAKLQKIAEQTRKELEKAEQKEEEENNRKLIEAEQKREREQRKLEEQRKAEEENALKLAEAEKQREQEQRRKEEEEQKRKEDEENARIIMEKEKQREAEQRRKEEEEAQREAEENALKEQRRKYEEELAQKEAEENARKIMEIEKQRETEQRRKEQEQAEREALEKQREEEELEIEENNRKLLEAEKLQEEEQRKKEEDRQVEENKQESVEITRTNEDEEAQKQQEEEEENERKYLEIEHKLEEQLRAAEQEDDLTEKERQLIESIKQRDIREEDYNEQKEADLLRRILEAQEQLTEDSEEEQSLRLVQREQDQEAKQRRIEENALLFLEAEKEMAEIQQQMQEAVEKRLYASNLDSAPQTPICEEPCIKKFITPLLDEECEQPVTQRVKTQLKQDLNESSSYTVTSKPLLFPGVSDEGSSVEPNSSYQSSFSTQPSEEVATGTDSQYPPQQERQEPEGEDTTPSLKYSEDYLRSLDGIKQRPLIRDSTGRRRAFKKRRSSNSSNSSRESRNSRDEEMKMFTSLEEEEMKSTADSEFTPIRYTSEPTLQVKRHHRRHKRSPAKDMKSDDSLRSSLERLGEETSDPWGEVQPEHYKNSDFWKREKALSIDEEIEFERPASSEELNYDTATNLPSTSSFEEATQIQNEQALKALRKQASKEPKNEELDVKAIVIDESNRSDNKTNRTEKEASPTQSSASPNRRFEKMDIHEEKASPSCTSPVNTPSISIHSPPDFGPWRDEHGLMMEGLSDFYDFTASINPSRSRNTSRNPSPANSAPNTPLPKNISFDLEITSSIHSAEKTVEIYDDTGDLEKNEFKKENIIKFIDSLNDRDSLNEQVEYELSTDLSENSLEHEIKYVMDDLSKESENRFSKSDLVPLVNIIEDSSLCAANENDNHDAMNSLVDSLRTQRLGGSRSRSKSPLPTPGNLQRSLENRRDKMIRHNEDILEKLIESNLLPETPPTNEETEVEAMNLLVDSMRTQRSRSNSLRSRSPLPSDTNIERSLEHRRNKRIQENDELIEKYNSPSSGSQSPIIFNDSFKEDDKISSSPEEEIQTLKVDQQRSRSKSPMRLPSAKNLNNSIDSRRNKLIERNDEFQKQIEERIQTPETPNLTMEYVYEFENNSEVNETILQSIEEKSQSSLILQTPTISVEFNNTGDETSAKVEEAYGDCSRENMNLLVQSLRVARSRSRTPIHRRSRSISPVRFPAAEELQTDQNENSNTPETVEYIYEFETTTTETATQIPAIVLQSDDADDITFPQKDTSDFDNCSREEMNSLVQSLRAARSRSKSPMRLPTTELQHHAESDPDERSRFLRSNTPSRSRSHESSASPNEHSELNDFHVMLNLEGSNNKTLLKNSEELESLKLYRQRKLDEEALEQLINASEEMELRTLSPLILDHDELNEQQSMDFLADLPISERAKFLRKSPTTPDYDRTFSEEMQDVERIKQQMLEKRFKRSTYVGESLDIGSEYESLRREAAQFQRSHSPSPSFSRTDIENAQLKAEEKRKIQDMILAELTDSSQETVQRRKTGAIPKTERVTTTELQDNSKIKEDILEEESIDNSYKYEEMRRRNADFIRSASKSRSPLKEAQLKELVEIEKEAVKRELQDKVLDEISNNAMNFQEFSKHLNPDFLDNDRRASDSALIQKSEFSLQFQDNNYDPSMDMEPEEYHHYRRFSLAQEQPVEEYPNDDYIFLEQIEVRTHNTSQTWVREEFYTEDVNDFLSRKEETVKNNDENKESIISNEFALSDTEANSDNAMEQEDHGNDDSIEENLQQLDERDDDEYSNNSDDRQTVVEVDDEIDEDISDFKGEESHHETSECEEADREMDRYAGRDASDWNQVANVQDENQGAVGGSTQSPYDSDSFAIDQIYDEAIKNRKQSGILREYDSILMQMSKSDSDDQYAQTKKKPKNVEFNVNFLDNERKDTEIRYLGNAKATERQSVRLRSRYGYNPVLQTNLIDDDIDVDLNYVPKKEYNWRKNFKLDEESFTKANEKEAEQNPNDELQLGEEKESVSDIDRASITYISQNSLEGESLTLYNKSPERTILEEDYADNADNEDAPQDSPPFKEVNLSNELEEENLEKPKKKKTKKKSRKESRESLEFVKKDEEALPDSYIYSRRSSSIQMETDSPKRKSRSRRSSKSSLTNDDSPSLFSPRNSVGYAEPIADIMEEYTETVNETVRPKKIKKRKKAKETMTYVTESSIQNKEEPLFSVEPISAIVTPESYNVNILSTLSPQNSVCVTPVSIELELNGNLEEEIENVTASPAESIPSPTSPTVSSSNNTNSPTSPVDSFDILKDANFYPLF